MVARGKPHLRCGVVRNGSQLPPINERVSHYRRELPANWCTRPSPISTHTTASRALLPPHSISPQHCLNPISPFLFSHRVAHLELRWQLMLSGRGLKLGHLSVSGGHLQGSLPTWQQHSGHVRYLQVRRHPEQHKQAQVMLGGGEQVPG